MSNFNSNRSTNQSRAEEYNSLQRRIADFYKEPVVALIAELRRIGYSLDQIANIPDFPFSKQALATNYLLPEQDRYSNRSNTKSKTISLSSNISHKKGVRNDK